MELNKELSIGNMQNARSSFYQDDDFPYKSELKPGKTTFFINSYQSQNKDIWQGVPITYGLFNSHRHKALPALDLLLESKNKYESGNIAIEKNGNNVKIYALDEKKIKQIWLDGNQQNTIEINPSLKKEIFRILEGYYLSPEHKRMVRSVNSANLEDLVFELKEAIASGEVYEKKIEFPADFFDKLYKETTLQKIKSYLRRACKKIKPVMKKAATPLIAGSFLGATIFSGLSAEPASEDSLDEYYDNMPKFEEFYHAKIIAERAYGIEIAPNNTVYYNGNNGIYTINLDGSNNKIVEEDANINDISKDGEKFIIATYDDNTYITDKNFTKLKKIYNDWSFDAEWSPDGSMILLWEYDGIFKSTDGGDKWTKIYSYTAEGDAELVWIDNNKIRLLNSGYFGSEVIDKYGNVLDLDKNYDVYRWMVDVNDKYFLLEFFGVKIADKNNLGNEQLQYPMVQTARFADNSTKIVMIDEDWRLAVIDSSYYENPENEFFVQLTDLHIGANGADKRLEEVISNILEKPKPKFALLTGDLVEFGDGDDGAKNFESLLSITKRLSDAGIKVYYLPGNHDYRNFMHLTLDKSLKNYHTLINPDDNFVIEEENLFLIGLNSGYDAFTDANVLLPEGSGLTDAQMQWLEEQEKKIGDRKVIVAMHHPIMTSKAEGELLTKPRPVTQPWESKYYYKYNLNIGSRYYDPNSRELAKNIRESDGVISQNRDKFMEWCNENGVQLVLGGHTHKFRAGIDFYTPLTVFVQTSSAAQDMAYLKINYAGRVIAQGDYKRGFEVPRSELVSAKKVITAEAGSPVELQWETSGQKGGKKDGEYKGDAAGAYYQTFTIEGKKRTVASVYPDGSEKLTVEGTGDGTFNLEVYYNTDYENIIEAQDIAVKNGSEITFDFSGNQIKVSADMDGKDGPESEFVLDKGATLTQEVFDANYKKPGDSQSREASSGSGASWLPYVAAGIAGAVIGGLAYLYRRLRKKK